MFSLDEARAALPRVLAAEREIIELRPALVDDLEKLADRKGAEARLAESGDDVARLHAQHAAERAHDHIAVAESGLARARAMHCRCQS